jgi:hypothetical protein
MLRTCAVWDNRKPILGLMASLWVATVAVAFWAGHVSMSSFRCTYHKIGLLSLNILYAILVVQPPFQMAGCFVGEAKMTLWIAYAAITFFETGTSFSNSVLGM